MGCGAALAVAKKRCSHAHPKGQAEAVGGIVEEVGMLGGGKCCSQDGWNHSTADPDRLGSRPALARSVVAEKIEDLVDIEPRGREVSRPI